MFGDSMCVLVRFHVRTTTISLSGLVSVELCDVYVPLSALVCHR